MIGRGTWFQKLFGFREAGYSSTKQQFEYDPTLGTLKSKAKPERVFIAGRFETPSLEELRARVDLGAAREALGNKRIRVCEVVDDASLIHSKPDNSGALFQAASQFNALEHASQHGTPEDLVAITNVFSVFVSFLFVPCFYRFRLWGFRTARICI